MLVVLINYRGILEVRNLPDSTSDKFLNNEFASNWFRSSKQSESEAIMEAKEAGLRYVEPDEEDEAFCERMRNAELIPLRRKDGRPYRF